MGTSAGFVPAAVPECPYAPRMTRAAAQALAAGAGMRENCVVVITDGPTIGTAGNTAVTEIELQPNSPTELGMAALVHTPWDDQGWVGVYNLFTNSITELTDNIGNTVKDIDANAPTVHTQFPWHIVSTGGGIYRDNYIEDSTLTGWDTSLGAASNNRILGSTVNLTGKTAGPLQDNEFTAATLTLGAGGASATLIRTTVAAATVNHTGTGSLSMLDSEVRDGFIIAASTAASTTVSDSRCYNHGTAPADISNTAAAGSILVNDCEIDARPNALPTLDNQGMSGNMAIARVKINASQFIRVAGATAPMSITDSQFNAGTITQGAGATGSSLTVQDASVSSSVVTQNGAGPVSITSGSRLVGATVTNSAAASRGFTSQTSELLGCTVTQNRTGGAGVDLITNSELSGISSLTLNGAVDPAQSQTILNRTKAYGTTLITVTDPAAVPVILQNCEIHNSTVTVPAGGGLTTGSRFSAMGVNLGAFTGHGSVIIEGIGGTKTLTAVNTNRLANKSFDDTI